MSLLILSSRGIQTQMKPTDVPYCCSTVCYVEPLPPIFWAFWLHSNLKYDGAFHSDMKSKPVLDFADILNLISAKLVSDSKLSSEMVWLFLLAKPESTWHPTWVSWFVFVRILQTIVIIMWHLSNIWGCQIIIIAVFVYIVKNAYSCTIRCIMLGTYEFCPEHYSSNQHIEIISDFASIKSYPKLVLISYINQMRPKTELIHTVYTA